MTSTAYQATPDNFKTRVFVSYSRKDITFVDRLGVELERKGVKPSIDRKDIFPAQDWQKRLHDMIAQSDTIIFVLSPDATESTSCSEEVEFASSLNKRFVPIVCRKVSVKVVPYALRRLQFIFFDDESRFDESLNQLIDAIFTDIEWVSKHTELVQAARLWDMSGRPYGRLLVKYSLNEALHWVATRPRGAPLPTDLIQDFIRASRKARRRSQNLVAAISLLVTVGSLALAIWAVWERKIAEESFSAVQSAADDVTIKLARQIRDVRGISQDVILLVLPKIEAIANKLTEIDAYSKELMFSKVMLYYEFANTYWFAGNIEKAETYITKSLRLNSELLDQTFDKNVRLKLVEQRILGYMQNGHILRVTGKTKEAVDAYQLAKNDCDELVKLTSGNFKAWGSLTDAIARIGDAERTGGHFDKANMFYIEAKRIQQEFRDEGVNASYWDNMLSWSYNRFGDNALKIRNHEGLITIYGKGKTVIESVDAISYYKRSLELRKELVKNTPDNIEYRSSLAWAFALYGMSLLSSDAKLASKVLDEGLNEVKQLIEADQKNTEWLRYRALMYNFLGDAFLLDGRTSEAFAQYEEGLSVRRTLCSIDPKNARWKRDLFYTLYRMSEMHRVAEHSDGTIYYRHSALDVADQTLRYFPEDEALALAVSKLRR